MSHLVFERRLDSARVAFVELMQGVDEAEILNIETVPSHRQQGLAASLLLEAFEWCKKNNRTALWLEVRTSNEAAVQLYRKMGFMQISTRTRYYADGADALVMKYTL